MKFPNALGALAFLAFGVSACGSTAPNPNQNIPASLNTAGLTPGASPTVAATTGTAQTPAQQLQAAVQAYSNTYLGGNGTAAFALLSTRCQQSIGLPQISSEASAAKDIYGVLPLASFTIDSMSGSMATVSYTYAVTTLNQSNQAWILQGSSWRYDGC